MWKREMNSCLTSLLEFLHHIPYKDHMQRIKNNKKTNINLFNLFNIFNFIIISWLAYITFTVSFDSFSFYSAAPFAILLLLNFICRFILLASSGYSPFLVVIVYICFFVCSFSFFYHTNLHNDYFLLIPQQSSAAINFMS